MEVRNVVVACCFHGPEIAEGRFTYSDLSGHPCCRKHVEELKGLAHGPGRFISYVDA